jgi:cytochrome c
LLGEMTEGANDGQYDAWNDVGHGICLVVGRDRLDPGGRGADQIPPHREPGLSAMNKLIFIGLSTIALSSPSSAQHSDVAPGQRNFRMCAPCHSLEPDRNMTGPSLADLWGRKAGSLPSFERYSDALKSSGIIWDDRSLDAWLTDPDRMVPDNEMPFNGITDPQRRADLLAFLKEATKAGTAPQMSDQGQMGGMGGMMGGRAPNLKNLESNMQVKMITYCHDTYRVTTADGKTRAFWERNLRLKTDSGKDGPQNGAPALVPAGMMGDRADVIFAGPEEISRMIDARC